MELAKINPNYSIGDEPHHAPALGQPAHNFRLLAVDDITMNCDLISLQFQYHGYRVDKAYSGAEALALVEKESFDLILLDMRMPEMDGLEVLRRLRQKYSALELPVIMVTGEGQGESVTEALQMGANDYLAKPLDMPLALARIKSQLTLQRMATIQR